MLNFFYAWLKDYTKVGYVGTIFFTILRFSWTIVSTFWSEWNLFDEQHKEWAKTHTLCKNGEIRESFLKTCAETSKYMTNSPVSHAFSALMEKFPWCIVSTCPDLMSWFELKIQTFFYLAVFVCLVVFIIGKFSIFMQGFIQERKYISFKKQAKLNREKDEIDRTTICIPIQQLEESVLLEKAKELKRRDKVKKITQ